MEIECGVSMSSCIRAETRNYKGHSDSVAFHIIFSR